MTTPTPPQADRRPMAAGNWKMHKTVSEAVESAKELSQQISDVKETDILIAPSFTALRSVGEAVRGTPIRIAAQDMHWKDQGAYTGEISPLQLLDVGCTAVLVGHSERRQLFGETDETVGQKMNAALRHDLTPIFCIGETEAERKAGKTEGRLAIQIQSGLEGLTKEQTSSILIAYEPVWAIGTGVVARPEQVSEAHRFIRKKFGDIFGRERARGVRILYGGSVTPDNIGELARIEDLDGVLVGGASLKPAEFAGILRALSHVKGGR